MILKEAILIILFTLYLMEAHLKEEKNEKLIEAEKRKNNHSQ